MIRDPFRFYQVPPPAPTYFGGTLPTVVVQSSYPDGYVANAVRQGGSRFFNTAGRFMGQPQMDMMELFTGIEQTPSEALGITNPIGSFAVNAVADPLNMLGVNALTRFAGIRAMGAPLQQGVKSTGRYLTQGPLSNTYKMLGNDTRFFNPGETPHWIKGHQQDWNPMIADLEPLANFREQQATRILNNTKMFKESEAIRNKYADKLDELSEQKKYFLKSNDKDAVLDADRQIAEIFNNRDKDFDVLNKKYFTSKEHPFNTRLGSGAYGSVYGLPKLNYAVKVGDLPKGEDSYKLVELSKNIEKSNIAVPKRAYNTSSGENVMVMSKVDPIQGNFALNPPTERSYRELIKDVKALRDKGLYLDFQNPENIRYNPSTGLFNIYDLNSTGYMLGKKIDKKSYDVGKKTVQELLIDHEIMPKQFLKSYRRTNTPK